MNINIKTTPTCRVMTCRNCHNAVAKHGSFCPACDRIMFPQDYDDTVESEDTDESPVYRRVGVDMWVEVTDREECGALRSDNARDDR